MQRTIFTTEHDEFRAMLRDFIAREVVPQREKWDELGRPERDFFRRLGELGILGIEVPEEYGGAGESSFKYPGDRASRRSPRAGVSFGSYGVHAAWSCPTC